MTDSFKYLTYVSPAFGSRAAVKGCLKK